MTTKLDVAVITEHSGDRVTVVGLTTERGFRSWRFHPDFDGLSERTVRKLCDILNGVVDALARRDAGTSPPEDRNCLYVRPDGYARWGTTGGGVRSEADGASAGLDRE